MNQSPITFLRRLVALGIIRLGSPFERQLCRRMESSASPRLDGSPDHQVLVEAGLNLLRNRWPFGLRLVERYVDALIEVGISDEMGFISGVWAFKGSHFEGKTSPEEVAIRLVKMAMLRKAYLVLGWKGYLMNERFNRVGFRLIDKGKQRIYTTAECNGVWGGF